MLLLFIFKLKKELINFKKNFFKFKKELKNLINNINIIYFYYFLIKKKF